MFNAPWLEAYEREVQRGLGFSHYHIHGHAPGSKSAIPPSG